MEQISTMVLKLKHQERRRSPFLACQMSKWFYSTSTDTATRAAHCGLLLEGLRPLALQLWMKQGGHDDFTWFEPPERNTLHPQDELYCYVCSSS
jgi:hypothetical protein